MQRRSLKIHPKDTVVTLLEEAKKGDVVQVDNQQIVLLQDVPFAHKVAIQEINLEAPVYKYGETIGNATAPIQAGEWVHDHNLAYNQWK